MMTKLRKRILLPALLVASVSGFVACGVDRWKEYTPQIAVDTWMYDILQQHYLWYQDLPAYKDMNPFLEPSQFLSKAKSKNDNCSFVDSVMETPLPCYGFDYSLVRHPDIDTAYNALITYVIPGSPAAAVLKRGDWIVKVDTSYISKKYETQLLQGVRPLTVTLGKYQLVPPTELPDEEEEEEPQEVYKVVPVGQPVNIGAAVSLTDRPIHCKKILPLADGSEVGYLMYNSFVAGTKEHPEEYNDELREWSNELSQRGIRNVILDLRHNNGGSIECMQLLSTLLVSSSFLDRPMAYLEYNDKNTEKDAVLTFDSNLPGTSGKNLNTTTLIVLISGETAGAPEMLMNCLNGKIQRLIAIGSSTKGQNVATEQFVNEEYRWSIHPVVCTVYNSEHETYGGFKPTYSVNATTNYLTYLPFGEEDETLLSVALGVLNNTYPPQEEKSTGKSFVSPVIEKSVSSPASRRFVGGGGLQLSSQQ